MSTFVESLVSALLNAYESGGEEAANNSAKIWQAYNITPDMAAGYDEQYAALCNFYNENRTLPSLDNFRDMVSGVPTNGYRMTDINELCRRTVNVYVKRNIADFARDMATENLAKVSAEELITAGLNQFTSMSSRLANDRDTNVFDDYEDTLKDVAARHERARVGGLSGVTSGISIIDDTIGGYNPGELVVYGARLGSMKSFTMQHSAASAALAGHRVLFNALEQTRAQATMRIHALIAGQFGFQFSNMDLMRGKNYDIAQYRKFLGIIKDKVQEVNGALHVADTVRGPLSLAKLRAQIERHEPELVFIDYITLMATDGPDWQGIAMLSSGLKRIAMQYEIPVVAAAQLNRENGLRAAGSNEPPGVEAIAQADKIGQDSDVVITMQRMSQRVLVLKIAKSRNGGDGTVFYMNVEPGSSVYDVITPEAAREIAAEDKIREDENLA